MYFLQCVRVQTGNIKTVSGLDSSVASDGSGCRLVILKPLERINKFLEGFFFNRYNVIMFKDNIG